MRSFSLPDRAIGWLLPVLAILAEGAFLAVIYVTVEVVVDGRPPLLGTFELATAAGIAAIAARRKWADPDASATRFLGLLAILGLAGWLWSADARALVADGELVDAVTVHPGGWLMVVAGMRGVGRAVEVDDRAVTRLVLVGVPALAIPWSLGQLASGELRQAFTDQAFVASITFVAAGFMAAGLARLQEIGRETGVDWRGDRSWMSTVAGVLVVVLGLGIPASMLLGLPGDAVLRGVLGPILTLVGYAFAAVAAVAALIAFVLAQALRRIGFEMPAPMTPAEIARLQEVPTYTIEQLRGGLTALMVGWVILAIVIIVLVRVWIRRRKRFASPTTTEERSFQLPDRAWRLTMPRPSRRTPSVPIQVRDGVTAYLAALGELAAQDPSRGRAAHETPRAHALRVAEGRELAGLQADYSLARYGGRPLTPAEHRRAIGRWQRLRDRLRT